MKTTKSGRLSDSTVLTGTDKIIEVLPKHSLTVDINYSVDGIVIHEGGTLVFERKTSLLLKSTKNIVNMGRLILKPLTMKILHQIQFIDINESNFVGGGHHILDSDIGLWVIGNGVLEIEGTTKNAYSYLTGDGLINQSISVKNSLNWQSDDEIVVAPTQQGSYAFSSGKFKDIKLQHNHPTNDGFTAEVLNLTRNVIIGGTISGRSHISIMSKKPQVIKYCQLKYMGPRKNGAKVMGRYAIHFHHCMDGSKGSIITGVVTSDCGSHSFVSHCSHGVTFDSCIAYNVNETAFWWDQPANQFDNSNDSNNTKWLNCVAAGLYPIPAQRGYDLSGFILGSGFNNEISNCTVIADMGKGTAGAFNWPEDSNYTPNLWKSENLTAHNCYAVGIRNWQNDDAPHLINKFVVYNCHIGILHGAYRNGYTYQNGLLFNNTKCDIEIHALPNVNATPDDKGYKTAFKSIILDKINVMPHTLSGDTPILIKDCKIKEVIVMELPPRVPNPPPSKIDFVNCSQFSHIIQGMQANGLHRIQTIEGDCWSIDHTGTINKIDFFY